MNKYGFNTSLLHIDEEKDRYGTTTVPIYQTSAFYHESAEKLGKIFENRAAGYSYTRVNNPTIEAFERRITMLEGGFTTVACSSGMAALANAFLNILRSGDEIVAAAGLYGGTVGLLNDLIPFDITTRYVKNNIPEEFEKLITDRTRLVFAETIGNPKLDVTDIKAVAEVSHSRSVPLIIDNTTATAYLVRPLELGADIVVNSSSKYINGGGNAIGGTITDSGRFGWDKDRYPGMKDFVKFGPMAYTSKLRNDLFRNLGACISPQNAFLNCIGMETLGLRMERQCGNALKLAEFLQRLRPDFTVNYPGLPDSPYYELSRSQFRHEGFGAIITFRAGSRERAFHIMDELKLPYLLSNIGDIKTLAVHPASTLALHLTEQEKADSGVYDDLIRISVGIEDIEDLQEDFENAVKNLV